MDEPRYLLDSASCDRSFLQFPTAVQAAITGKMTMLRSMATMARKASSPMLTVEVDGAHLVFVHYPFRTLADMSKGWVNLASSRPPEAATASV